MKVWLNGRVLDEAEARISPFDHGLMTGNGVFETLRIYRGVPFAWTRHAARLRRSADGLGLGLPDQTSLRDAAAAVIEANGIAQGRLRITVTGGPSPLGSERGHEEPTVLLAATEMRPWLPTVDVATVPWTRNEMGAAAGLKTISYAENVRALAYAKERGAGEAIFANTSGHLCEATGSNVFLARDGSLHTPPAASGCLLGVTRNLLLELAPTVGVAVEEADLPLSALAEADEAFLTSSTREVHSISAVDGTALADAPGPITTQLAAAFTGLVERELDP